MLYIFFSYLLLLSWALWHFDSKEPGWRLMGKQLNISSSYMRYNKMLITIQGTFRFYSIYVSKWTFVHTLKSRTPWRYKGALWMILLPTRLLFNRIYSVCLNPKLYIKNWTLGTELYQYNRLILALFSIETDHKMKNFFGVNKYLIDDLLNVSTQD